MPLSQAQTRAFFTDARQMAMPLDTVNGGLMAEGIDDIEGLEEFNNDNFKSIQENLRKPAGTISDPANARKCIPTPSVLGAKSIKRLRIAAEAVRYYETVGRDCTAGNMHYQNVLREFGEQCP